MAIAQAPDRLDPRVLWLKAVLLAAWAGVSFGLFFFARDLQFVVAGWPFAYWLGAQGAIIIFIAIVVIYAVVMNRLAPEDSAPDPGVGPHV